MLYNLSCNLLRGSLGWLAKKGPAARFFLLIPTIIVVSIAFGFLSIVDIFYNIIIFILVVFNPKKINKKYFPSDFTWPAKKVKEVKDVKK